MYSTNGMPAPPLSVLRLSISRYVGAEHDRRPRPAVRPRLRPRASSPFAAVAKYRMIASDTRPMIARIPMLPIIGAQVPSLSSAPSVLESYQRKPPMISAARHADDEARDVRALVRGMRAPELPRQHALAAHREQVARRRVEERELARERARHDRELERPREQRGAADVDREDPVGLRVEDRCDVAVELRGDAAGDAVLAPRDHEHPADERVEDARARSPRCRSRGP